jgi:F0F1-type ATP synthase membrane subunit b/b'
MGMLSNWNFFYCAFIFILILGILAGIFADPIKNVMEDLETKASGRSDHYS